jgi:hypothetical protein
LHSGVRSDEYNLLVNSSMFIQCLVYRSYLFLWAMFVVFSSQVAEFDNFQDQELILYLGQSLARRQIVADLGFQVRVCRQKIFIYNSVKPCGN